MPNNPGYQRDLKRWLPQHSDDLPRWEPTTDNIDSPRLRAEPATKDSIDELSPSQPLIAPEMIITQSAQRQMMEYLLGREPESAGLLLGPADDDFLITHFVPDETGRGTSVSFELDAATLNNILRRVKPAGINCKGIAHAHPPGVPSPSAGDLAYLRRLFGLETNAAAVQFYMPIVCSGRLHPYVYAHGQVHRAEIVLI